MNIGGRPFKIKDQFLSDLEQNASADIIGKLDKALLIMHSPQDNIVGIENAAEIYDHARHPKSFITLDGSDHLLTNHSDADYAGLIAASWAFRYITSESVINIAPEGEVWTRLSGNRYLTEITAGVHHMIADEPKSSGGDDLGPSPYGYLLSALGTCTTMTLRMYADYKKIDLTEINVELTQSKIHLEDGQKAEKATAKIDQIKLAINLKGNLSTEQRKRLIEIAKRCPVHKTLLGTPQIITEEKE